MSRLVLLLALLLGVSPAFAKPRDTRKKVAVLPFQAVSADVPARSGPRVAARLASELHVTPGLRLATPPASEDAPPPDALSIARAAVKEAVSAREARDFPRADAALGRALEAYAAGAASLTDASELADAYALRAAVRYATGRDDEATATLSHALAIAPGRALPLASTSSLFAHTVERVRTEGAARPRGSVRIGSVPPGVAVTLDGHPVGTAPVRVTGVPPGAHLWRAVLPSGDTVGGVVEVAPGREAEVTVLPTGTGPTAKLALALAYDRLDAEALDAASALGREAKADLVVFGTVSREGNVLAVDAFVLAPGATAPRRLPRQSMDAELLEAGAPLQALANALAAQGAEAGTEAALPVTPSGRTPVEPVRSVIAYPTAGSAPETPATPSPERKPQAPNRKPLVRP
jgi:hypothetical protein